MSGKLSFSTYSFSVKAVAAFSEYIIHHLTDPWLLQAPNKIPADIVFIIRDKPHLHFRREGPDLKYTCRISLKEVGHCIHYLSGGDRLIPLFISWISSLSTTLLLTA